jgi:2-polyprenyl-3-methyl-5-hydroxy-6-metoxy-1,4-benzoquinol methylase
MADFWKQQADEWGRPPIAGKNLPTAPAAEWNADQRRAFVMQHWRNHWGQHGGEVPRLLRLTPEGLNKYRTFLDVGCGWGFDAMRAMFTAPWLEIGVADLCRSNVVAAQRLARAFGHKIIDVEIDSVDLCIYERASYDIVHCNGVLHHVPDGVTALRNLCAAAKHEVRLMLYGTPMLHHATEGAAVPVKLPVSLDWCQGTELGRKWVRFADAVGHYATPWDLRALENATPQRWRVAQWEPFNRGWYVAAILEREDKCVD